MTDDDGPFNKWMDYTWTLFCAILCKSLPTPSPFKKGYKNHKMNTDSNLHVVHALITPEAFYM